MSCLPSATYAGPGSTDNLWLPADGSATIRGNLEVTGDAVVDGGLYGPGGDTPVRCPAGAVGANGNTPLPTPQGIRISAGGSFPSDITATQTGGGAFLVNFQHGVRVTQGAFLNGVTQVGTTIGSGILLLVPQDGMGSLGAPIVVAPGGSVNMNGNKAFVQITGAGSVVVNPDTRLNGQGVPSVWCFTDNTQPIQNYFRSNSIGVVTLTAVGGGQTFGVIYL